MHCKVTIIQNMGRSIHVNMKLRSSLTRHFVGMGIATEIQSRQAENGNFLVTLLQMTRHPTKVEMEVFNFDVLAKMTLNRSQLFDKKQPLHIQDEICHSYPGRH